MSSNSQSMSYLLTNMAILNLTTKMGPKMIMLVKQINNSPQTLNNIASHYQVHHYGMINLYPILHK